MSPVRLALGCASAMGRVNRRQSLRAFATAYEHGVRRFDVARSYGWGEAEGLLGEFLAGRPRDGYEITTKCGILPTRPGRIKSLAKGMARQVMDLFPATRSVVKTVAAGAVAPTRTTDIGALSQSLDTSLRELGTDYVDTLLLHNFVPDFPELDRVIEFFERARTAGKTRNYGLSITGNLRAGLARIEREWVDGRFVVQVPVSGALFVENPAARGLRVQAYAPFRFMKEQGLDGSDGAALLAALSKRAACELVICSMMTPAHIAANVETAGAAERVNSAGIDEVLGRLSNRGSGP